MHTLYVDTSGQSSHKVSKKTFGSTELLLPPNDDNIQIDVIPPKVDKDKGYNNPFYSLNSEANPFYSHPNCRPTVQYGHTQSTPAPNLPFKCELPEAHLDGYTHSLKMSMRLLRSLTSYLQTTVSQTSQIL